MKDKNMTSLDVVAHVLQIFNDLHLPYMLVGSLSLNLYAVPRHTNDADFVAEFGDIPITAIAAKLGPDFMFDRQIGFETITSTTQYKLEHIPTGFVIELFELTDDPHDHMRFSRRKMITLAGIPAFVPTAEDVIVQKIKWAARGRRTKDLADTENIIRVQKSLLDLAYIRHWCLLHGTEDLFEQIWADINK